MHNLDLLVEPRRGLTQEFLNHARMGKGATLALFSGPHSVTAPVERYDNVLMIASGFGLVTQLPYSTLALAAFTWYGRYNPLVSMIRVKPCISF